MKKEKAVGIVEPLIKGLKSDPAYRYGWQANIAMAFFDEVQDYWQRTGKRSLSRKDLHEISNLAADRFLTQLEYEPNPQPEVNVVDCPLCSRGQYCAEDERLQALSA